MSIFNLFVLEKYDNGKLVINLEGNFLFLDIFLQLFFFENQYYEVVKENNILKFCFFFERYGNCKYGNNCRFLYVLLLDEKVKIFKFVKSYLVDKKSQYVFKKIKYDK